MTAYPGIAPPLYSHGWFVALVLSLGTLWETAFGGVLLLPSVISVYREQDCPRQRLLAVWTFFVRPRIFLPSRCEPWAWYEMDWGCQILWPHTHIQRRENVMLSNTNTYHKLYSNGCLSTHMSLKLNSLKMGLSQHIYDRSLTSLMAGPA